MSPGAGGTARNLPVRVKAPATSANLGPGFDCAGAALDLWNELEVSEGEGVEATSHALAEDHVIRVASLRPNEHTARKAIVAELSKIDGFTVTGPQAFCGKGSYKALMEALAKRNDRIRVTRASGTGISSVA